MTSVLPEPLAILKREHDEEKKKLEELVETKSLRSVRDNKNFQEAHQRIIDS